MEVLAWVMLVGVMVAMAIAALAEKKPEDENSPLGRLWGFIDTLRREKREDRHRKEDHEWRMAEKSLEQQGLLSLQLIREQFGLGTTIYTSMTDLVRRQSELDTQRYGTDADFILGTRRLVTDLIKDANATNVELTRIEAGRRNPDVKQALADTEYIEATFEEIQTKGKLSGNEMRRRREQFEKILDRYH